MYHVNNMGQHNKPSDKELATGHSMSSSAPPRKWWQTAYIGVLPGVLMAGLLALLYLTRNSPGSGFYCRDWYDVATNVVYTLTLFLMGLSARYDYMVRPGLTAQERAGEVAIGVVSGATVAGVLMWLIGAPPCLWL